MIFSIFGQRDVQLKLYEDYAHVSQCLTTLGDIDRLMLGGGLGLDNLCQRWAEEHSVPYDIIAPEFPEHPKVAFEIRNTRMIEECEICVVFWDGLFKPTSWLISKIVIARKTLILFPM